jgi:hypothetical protein
MPDVSRRTLVSTAVWSAPVIAFAAGVPAFAASGATEITYLPTTMPDGDAALIILMKNVPALSAGTGEPEVGAIVILCLPEEGVQVSVSSGGNPGWVQRDEMPADEPWFYSVAPVAAESDIQIMFVFHNVSGEPDRTISIETTVSLEGDAYDVYRPQELTFGAGSSTVYFCS